MECCKEFSRRLGNPRTMRRHLSLLYSTHSCKFLQQLTSTSSAILNIMFNILRSSFVNSKASLLVRQHMLSFCCFHASVESRLSEASRMYTSKWPNACSLSLTCLFFRRPLLNQSGRLALSRWSSCEAQIVNGNAGRPEERMNGAS